MVVAISEDCVVQELPQQGAVIEVIADARLRPFNLIREGVHKIAHQQRLPREVIEWMSPIQLQQAANERRRVSNEHYYVHVEGGSEPLS